MRAHTSDGIELEVEIFDGEGPPILLIMGLGGQMLLWPDTFCEQLAEAGHRVIRYDNRDVGLSSRLDHLGVPTIPGLLGRFVTRRAFTPEYTLSDMARDATVVLDTLEIERACVVGASMGGMIGQRMAIEHRDRMTSFVSIMSSPTPFWPEPRALGTLLARPGPTRDDAIAHTVRWFRQIGSQTYPPDADWLADVGGKMFDRGPTPQGFLRQLHAILADGDRRADLARVDLPTLVVHGAEDPLIPLNGGRETARALRAPLHIEQHMGHDLPMPIWDRLVREISGHATRHAHATMSPREEIA